MDVVYIRYLNKMWLWNYCIFCVNLALVLWFVCSLEVQEKDIRSHEDSPDECGTAFKLTSSFTGDEGYEGSGS